MPARYFLGANTPLGFRSEYDTLHKDARIRKLLILKGGPGCGKSTLMKTLASRAEECGWTVERALCSSDPDSLDGVLVPELGLALVDGTAPHVVEPALCGCGENYVNLGRCFRETELRRLAPALRAAQAENRACFEPAYACLRAAASLMQARRTLLGSEKTEPVTEEALRQLLPEQPSQGREAGTERRVFLSGVTPKGLMTLEPGADRLWTVSDEYGVGDALMRALRTRLLAAGETLTVAMDPLEPDSIEAVLVPGRSIGWLRTRQDFPVRRSSMLRLELDAAMEEGLSAELLDELRGLGASASALLRQAVGWLKRAKQAHDRLEALYRPAVDFAAVTRQTELLCRELFTEA